MSEDLDLRGALKKLLAVGAAVPLVGAWAPDGAGPDGAGAGRLADVGAQLAGQRAVLAAQAGMDLLLCSAQDPTEGQSVVTALASALNGGQLDSATFNAAVQRVTALRNSL
jgi:hypothetical protein